MCCGYRIPQPNEPILVVFCRQCLTYWYFGVHSKVRSAFLSCARPCRRTWSAFPAEIWTSTMLIPTFAAVQGWVSRQNWWTTDLHQILKGALLRMEISEDLPCINNMPICNANVQSFSIFEAATLRLEPLAHVSLATTQRPSRDCIWHWSAGGAGGWMVRMVVIWRPLRGGGGKRWCPHCRLSEGFQQNGTCGSWIAKWYIGRGVAYIYIHTHGLGFQHVPTLSTFGFLWVQRSDHDLSDMTCPCLLHAQQIQPLLKTKYAVKSPGWQHEPPDLTSRWATGRMFSTIQDFSQCLTQTLTILKSTNF